MPQVLKDSVRSRVREAALSAFAERGYAAATMTDIARRAGVVPANLYRYHSSKRALFEAVVPESSAGELWRLLSRSVREHAPLSKPRGEPPPGAGEGLLAFWVNHRHLTIILLARDEGTPFEGFGQRFVKRLVSLTTAELRRAHPGISLTREERLVLISIFDNTRRAIASLLANCATEPAIVAAVTAFRSYQVAGLAGFVRQLTANRGA